MRYEVLLNGVVTTATDSIAPAVDAFESHMANITDDADDLSETIELRMHPENKFLRMQYTFGKLVEETP